MSRQQIPDSLIPPALTRRLAGSLRDARIEQTALPLVPEISLYLLNADYPQGALSDDEVRWLMDNPAYWCFCWASGQVLARYLLDRPEWVRGKTVLDFGCGAGVVAIAAALAGASRVVACDLDPGARVASAANAALNGVELTLLDDLDHFRGHCDLMIVADVLYDRANLPLLRRFLERADEVLVADSRIRDFAEPGYRLIHRQQAHTVPDLAESEEFSRVSLYHGAHQRPREGEIT